MRGEEGLSTLWFNQRDVGLSALRREMKSCGTTVGFFTRMFASLAAKIDRILETRERERKREKERERENEKQKGRRQEEEEEEEEVEEED